MEQFRHGEWTIGLPEGWDDASTVTLVGPPEDDFSPNIVVTSEALSEEMSPAEYAAIQKEELEGTLEPFEYSSVEEGPMDMPQGAAHRLVHDFMSPAGDFKVGQMQVYVLREGRAWTITATDLAERLQQSLPVFVEAVRQFRFVPAH